MQCSYLWPSGLGNCIACKMLAVQTLLISLEFVIHNKSRAWHHRSFKLDCKLKYLNWSYKLWRMIESILKQTTTSIFGNNEIFLKTVNFFILLRVHTFVFPISRVTVQSATYLDFSSYLLLLLHVKNICSSSTDLFFHAWCWKIAKHISKILRCSQREILKVCLAVFKIMCERVNNI